MLPEMFAVFTICSNENGWCRLCLVSGIMLTVGVRQTELARYCYSAVDVWLTIRVSTAPQFSFQVFLPTVSYPGKAQRGNMYIR